MYKYFVSYSHERGFGNMSLTLEEKIKSHEDITLITEYIKQEGRKQVIILNFVQFEE